MTDVAVAPLRPPTPPATPPRPPRHAPGVDRPGRPDDRRDGADRPDPAAVAGPVPIGVRATEPPPEVRTTARTKRRSPPVIRMGVAWLVVLVAAVDLSPVLGALVLLPVAAVAATSAWRRQAAVSNLEAGWIAAAGAALAPLAAVAGVLPALLVVGTAAVALPMMTARDASWPDQVRVALTVAAPAAAAASVVLVARQGTTECVIMLLAVGLFDASNYIMGVGPTGGRLGTIAGFLSVVVLSVLVAGVFVVPFTGISSWLLCGAVAVGAPLAINGAHRLVGPARLPAWRRLDSLFIAGPLWVLGVSVLLHQSCPWV